MTNVLLKKEYPQQYTSTVSTRVSNALLVGEVVGQVVIGYVFFFFLFSIQSNPEIYTNLAA
jgi:hypothetical protein